MAGRLKKKPEYNNVIKLNTDDNCVISRENTKTRNGTVLQSDCYSWFILLMII